MDDHPIVMLNDALKAARDPLTKAGDAMSARLVELLKSEPYFAEFTITVTGSIIDPVTGDAVAIVIDNTVSYTVYWDRDPNRSDGTE